MGDHRDAPSAKTETKRDWPGPASIFTQSQPESFTILETARTPRSIEPW